MLDINPDILEQAKQRFESENIQIGYSFIESSAEDLSVFPDNHFDIYMISFGLRNVPNVQKSLEEAYRVLKPGGRYLCLEFAKVTNPVVDSVYQVYSQQIIPKIGKLVTDDEDSYRYLVESIDQFYSQEEMIRKLENAQFESVTSTDLSFGICSLYSGFKL